MHTKKRYMARVLPGILLVGAFVAAGQQSKTAGGAPNPGSGNPTRLQRAADQYRFLHADLTIHYCHPNTSSQKIDWASESVNEGFCDGTFKEGSEFSNQYGSTWWARGKNVPGVGNNLILITLGTARSGLPPTKVKIVSCYIKARNQGECYTRSSQVGKDKGSQGGPLSLAVQDHGFVLLRGWCQIGDGLCTPHVVKGNSAS